MIVIVDYGLSNLLSVANMVGKVGGICKISSQPKDILSADKLILPGVGAFDRGMGALNSVGLVEPLKNFALTQRKPILGICLGMQLMTMGSDEGTLPGLGWLNATVKRFSNKDGLKVPHMGWNTVSLLRKNPILPATKEEQRFYFVHSYKVVANEENIIIGETTYGEAFCSIFQKENIFGVQFHPEKSHKFGMNLIKNFLEH